MSLPALRLQRNGSEFNLALVLQILVARQLLSPSQAQDLASKEAAAKVRVLKQVGAQKDEARYSVSPVELVAVFQVPLGNGRVLDQDCISEAVAEALGIPYRKIDPLKLDMALATRTVSRPYAQKHLILPLERTPEGTLVVATANPFDRETLESVTRLAGVPVVPVLSAKADILRCIADIYGFKRTLAQAASDFSTTGTPQLHNFEQLVSLSSGRELDASDKPIVQAVDYLLRYAFEQSRLRHPHRAQRESAMVRFRIDGVLHTVYTLPDLGARAPSSRALKLIARMDISEKRRPRTAASRRSRDGQRDRAARSRRCPPPSARRWSCASSTRRRWSSDFARAGLRRQDEKGLFEP